MLPRDHELHVFFITNLCGGVEVEVPYLFKEWEPQLLILEKLFLHMLYHVY